MNPCNIEKTKGIDFESPGQLYFLIGKSEIPVPAGEVSIESGNTDYLVA